MRTLETAPSLTRLYAKAAIAAVLPGGDGLPDEQLELRQVRLERAALAVYARTCGFRLGDTLPPTYLHVHAFPLAVELMARPSFPFALPGLVHVANRITQHRPLGWDERPVLRVGARRLRPHRRGRQFEIVAEALVDGDPVWEDVSTYLARSGAPDDAAAVEEPGPATAPARAPAGLRLEVPADTGRRYAAVSGDRNPIHLSSLAARAFGFPRAIAHGMWTAARCLATLEGRLPPSLRYDVRFERPVLLPATVELSTVAADDGWRLALHAAERDDRHLTAEVGRP